MTDTALVADNASAATATVATPDDGKIVCQLDGVRCHIIQTHLRDHHPNYTIEDYIRDYPDAPLMSPTALAMKEKREKELAAKKAAQAAAAPAGAHAALVTESVGAASLVAKNELFHEVFELGNAPAAMNSMGKPIPCTVFTGHDHLSRDYLAEVDKAYVFNIDLLKKVMVGLQLNIPIYLWGMHGTGKTTVLEQAAARTRRPFLRNQHTINMQESDVLGQWTVKDGSTQFQLGPLPMAMIHGWVYCADEYDFAMPSVTALYQPVLEGKPLLIKEAPAEFRKIEPHPNFRFCATGNTNGGGDETGLYQGTLVQNAANYSRFGITEEVKYMEPALEENVICAKTRISKSDASRIVRFGNDIRKAFGEGKISATVSPRELICAARLGVAFGGNWKMGLELAFGNRLSRIDRKTVEQYLQRIFP